MKGTPPPPEGCGLGAGAGAGAAPATPSPLGMKIGTGAVVAGWVVGAGADAVVGTYWSAYWPRSNGFQTGYSRGGEKSRDFECASAFSMKRRQISAGKVPPATEMPCTFS